jgi:hypothetical protein
MTNNLLSNPQNIGVGVDPFLALWLPPLPELTAGHYGEAVFAMLPSYPTVAEREQRLTVVGAANLVGSLLFDPERLRGSAAGGQTDEERQDRVHHHGGARPRRHGGS